MLVFHSLEEKFWSNVVTNERGECWIWTGTKSGGYGRIKHGSAHPFAHRVSWELHNCKQIPPGLCVLHSCDNPPCVNPSHLSIGTQADNNLDRDRKGRQVAPRGEQHGKAKLTSNVVVDIRLAAGSMAEVAKRFGISTSQVFNIKHRYQWGHVA